MTKHANISNRALALASALLCVLACLVYALCLPHAARAADTAVGQLAASHQVTSASAVPATTTFTYELAAVSPDAPLPTGAQGGAYTFAMSAHANKSTMLLSFAEPGEHVYTLRCTGSNATDFTVDKTIYTVKAHVTDSSGALVAHVFVHKTGTGGTLGDKIDPNTTPLFKHVRLGGDNPDPDPDPDPIIVVDPPVKKTITGNPSEAAEFTFRLRAQEEGNPMPEGASNGQKFVTVVGQGIEEFGEWTYNAPGTYNYDISEVNTGDSNYRYDTTMYTITDVVSLVGGQFRVERTIVDSSGREVGSTLITPHNNNERSLLAEFTNEYIGGSSPTPVPGPTPTPNPDPSPDPNPTPSPNPSPNPSPSPEPTPNPNPTPDNAVSRVLGNLAKTYDTYHAQIWASIALIALFVVFLAIYKRSNRNR